MKHAKPSLQTLPLSWATLSTLLCMLMQFALATPVTTTASEEKATGGYNAADLKALQHFISFANPTTKDVVKSENRFFIQGEDFTINLLPFLLLLKVAFVLGLILKDVLAKEMEEYVSGYFVDGVVSSTYHHPTSLYEKNLIADPTRLYNVDHDFEDDEDVGNNNFQRVVYSSRPGPQILRNEDFSDYDSSESAAKAVAFTIDALGKLGSQLGTFLFGTPDTSSSSDTSDFHFVSNYEAPTQSTLDKGDFLRSLSITPPTTTTVDQQWEYNQFDQVSNYYSPPAWPTAQPQKYPDQVPSSLMFDPSSNTLYVDSYLANNLHLDDGLSVELPTDVLMDSINQGQVQLVNNQNNYYRPDNNYYNNNNLQDSYNSPSTRIDTSVQTRKKDAPIRDLLHYPLSKGPPKTFQNIMLEKVQNNAVDYNSDFHQSTVEEGGVYYSGGGLYNSHKTTTIAPHSKTMEPKHWTPINRPSPFGHYLQMTSSNSAAAK